MDGKWEWGGGMGGRWGWVNRGEGGEYVKKVRMRIWHGVGLMGCRGRWGKRGSEEKRMRRGLRL